MNPGYNTDDVSKLHRKCMLELVDLAKPVTSGNRPDDDHESMATAGETADNWKDSTRGSEGQQPKLQLP